MTQEREGRMVERDDVLNEAIKQLRSLHYTNVSDFPSSTLATVSDVVLKLKRLRSAAPAPEASAPPRQICRDCDAPVIESDSAWCPKCEPRRLAPYLNSTQKHEGINVTDRSNRRLAMEMAILAAERERHAAPPAASATMPPCGTSPCWCAECGGDPSPDPPEPAASATGLEPHAKKQTHADGFQAGWHAALERVAEGEDPDELRQIVPDTYTRYLMVALDELAATENWRKVALAFGEQLGSIGPVGYYDFTPHEWVTWASVALTSRRSPQAELQWTQYSDALRNAIVQMAGFHQTVRDLKRLLQAIENPATPAFEAAPAAAPSPDAADAKEVWILSEQTIAELRDMSGRHDGLVDKKVKALIRSHEELRKLRAPVPPAAWTREEVEFEARSIEQQMQAVRAMPHGPATDRVLYNGTRTGRMLRAYAALLPAPPARDGKEPR